MKIIKKLTILFTTALTLCSSIVLLAADIPVVSGDVTGEKVKGSEIVVNIDTTSVSNLGGVEIELSYNSSDLEYVSGEVIGAFTGSETGSAATDIFDNGDSIKISMMYGEALDASGTVATLKFKVLADEGKKVDLGMSAVFVDIDTYEEISVNVKGTSFIVETYHTSDLIYGDANGDLEVNSQDAVLIQKLLAGYKDTGANEEALDVNCDGEVTSSDAVLLLKYLAGYDVVLGAN